MSVYEVSSSEGNIMKYEVSKYPFSSARLFTKKQLNRIQLLGIQLKKKLLICSMKVLIVGLAFIKE